MGHRFLLHGRGRVSRRVRPDGPAGFAPGYRSRDDRSARRAPGDDVRAIDPATMRRLLLHEARVHAVPGRELRDLGDAMLLHDPARAGAVLEPARGDPLADDPDAFDRRLTEILVLFASLGRQPHIWASPLHDAPTDLVARLKANGFRDMGAGCVMALARPRSRRAWRPSRRSRPA